MPATTYPLSHNAGTFSTTNNPYLNTLAAPDTALIPGQVLQPIPQQQFMPSSAWQAPMTFEWDWMSSYT